MQLAKAESSAVVTALRSIVNTFIEISRLVIEYCQNSYRLFRCFGFGRHCLGDDVVPRCPGELARHQERHGDASIGLALCNRVVG
jgi:hypothetical protein